MDEPRAVLRLTRTVRDAARARAFVDQHLAELSESARYDATLIASELVTNVIVHGRLPAQLEIHDDPVRLVVRDAGPVFAYVRTTPSARSRHGRGLGIVAIVATAWGIDSDPGVPGKSVWAEVNLAPEQEMSRGDRI